MGNAEGWYMPRRYTNLVDEHMAARASCGIFDISHQSKFSIQGTGATEWMHSVFSSDINTLEDGQMHRSLLLNRQGTIVDKVHLCRENAEHYFILASTSQETADDELLRSKVMRDDIKLRNETEQWSAMHLQGPDSEQIFHRVLPDVPYPIPASFARLRYRGEQILLVRTDAEEPGSEGFLLYCRANKGIAWFEAFLVAGAIPCGMDARECLQLEHGTFTVPAGDEALTPHAAGLEKLSRHPHKPSDKRLVPIRCMEESDTPRKGDVVKDTKGRTVGYVVDGCISPALSHGVALALVHTTHCSPGTPLRLIIHGLSIPAMVTDATIN